jgi:hypothetical protein
MPIHDKPAAYVKTAFPTYHTTPESPFIWEPSKLHVIVPLTNACRYATRYHLFEKFEKMVNDAGAQLWVAEAAFGNRPHVVTHKDNPRHIQLRTWSEVWHKENLINIAFSRLPSDWEYVAWIDPDISFARPDWVNETLNQLQHFHIVQMFSHTHDLGPDFSVIKNHTGFANRYKNGGFDLPQHAPGELTMSCYEGRNLKLQPQPRPYYAHPGYAWAARREAINALGGLIDWAVLGSADWYMAYGLIGRIKETIGPGWSKSFVDYMLEWEQRAERHIRRNIGYVPGSILHHWHGRKKDRRYKERSKILLDNNYDPNLDLKRDSQGLWQLTDRSIGLRDQMRDYFRSRNEDSTEVA